VKQKSKNIIKEWVQSIVIALILALTVRTFLVQAYKIPTGSMQPTLMPGDRILVSKITYRIHPPEIGDVVVFRAPIEPKRDFIKRLAGKEGQILEIENGNLIVDSKIVEQPEIFNHTYYYRKGEFLANREKIEIPEDSYFMLGDNSLYSQDSRFWGFVPEKNIIGKAFVIYWPITRIRLIAP